MKPTTEDKAIAAEFRRICVKCGQPYALHGATSPHTRGEECDGFEPRVYSCAKHAKGTP